MPKPLGIAPGLGLSPVTTIIDGITYPGLNTATVLTTATIGGSTYALVASYYDDGVKIDDPYSPTNVSSIFDGTKYQELDGAISITTTTIGGIVCISYHSTWILVCVSI